MSISSTHSATVVATETMPTTIIPMHLEHHPHSHHHQNPPQQQHTTNTSTSTVSSSAAPLLQTTNLSCDTQTPTATHNLVAAPPQPQPTTIYVQNYATATPIIVHPSDNATTTYMAKITALPPS